MVIGLALESIPSVIIGVIRENCFLWSSFHIKNTHSLCRFSYACLSFNYVSSCLLDVQLGSILSFNYYFLSLNYPCSFSHLIITVCHAISYLMNFIELWLVAIQLFNIDSISIDRLYLSPQKHPLITDWRLRAGSFASFLHEVWKWCRWEFKMWAIPTEKEKIINEH